MKNFILNKSQQLEYKKNGFLIVPNLYDAEEIGLLLKICKNDQDKKHIINNQHKDSMGLNSKYWLSTDIDQLNIYNAISHGFRLVDTMEKLLDDEVYIYHYKMSIKDPLIGGSWEWHQDYGYWYQNNCIYPDMASVYIAVDAASKRNGCLQFLKGSHKMGRIDHGKFGTQMGADPERVKIALNYFELIYCEMSPGDAVFFDVNLLHRSDANESSYPRWGLICSYNTKHNHCDDRPGHASYRYLQKWPDDEVKKLGIMQLESMAIK